MSTVVRLRPSSFIVSGKHGSTAALIAVTRSSAEDAAEAARLLRERGYVEIVTVRA